MTVFRGFTHQTVNSPGSSTTKELDVRTGSTTLLVPGEGSQASGGNRYLTLGKQIVLRHRLKKRTIELPLERSYDLDCVLSLDVKCLAVQTDVLSVWTSP